MAARGKKAQEERWKRRTATVKFKPHRKRMAILKASQLQRASVIINGVFRICLAKAAVRKMRNAAVHMQGFARIIAAKRRRMRRFSALERIRLAIRTFKLRETLLQWRSELHTAAQINDAETVEDLLNFREAIYESLEHSIPIRQGQTFAQQTVLCSPYLCNSVRGNTECLEHPS